MAPEGGACVAAARKPAGLGPPQPDDTIVVFDAGSGYKDSEDEPSGRMTERLSFTIRPPRV